MTNLTRDQINQLNMYSVYVDAPERRLFSLEDLLDSSKTEDALITVQTISRSPNKTVAASYFMRRYGMFTAMQFYNLAVDDEVWKGESERFLFGAKEEYGNLAVSSFVEETDWQSVEEEERQQVIRRILLDTDQIIRQLRTVANVSPLTLWENIFGFLLWHYHVLLADPVTADIAYADMDQLKSVDLWKGIAPRSRFADYLKGSEPAALLNTVVRATCCLSKDVPGLIQCGFCPLK